MINTAQNEFKELYLVKRLSDKTHVMNYFKKKLYNASLF